MTRIWSIGKQESCLLLFILDEMERCDICFCFHRAKMRRSCYLFKAKVFIHDAFPAVCSQTANQQNTVVVALKSGGAGSTCFCEGRKWMFTLFSDGLQVCRRLSLFTAREGEKHWREKIALRRLTGCFLRFYISFLRACCCCCGVERQSSFFAVFPTNALAGVSGVNECDLVRGHTPGRCSIVREL